MPAEDLRQVVLKLGQLATEIGRNDKSLAREMQSIAREINQPNRAEDAKFRTRVAYAVQDVERIAAPLNIAPNLRTELKTLADTYPGLQNDRMRDLVASTAMIETMRIVRDIRVAAEKVTHAPDQNDKSSMRTVEAMEHKAVMAMSVAEQTGKARQAATTQPTEQTNERTAEASHATTLPNAKPTGQTAAQQTQPGRTVLDVMAALRRTEPEAPAPWDRQLTPMRERIGAYNTRMTERAEEQTFRAAEKSGQAALTAMAAFSEGPGSVLMARIRDAAKTDPNGMAGVMSEMREGGRHAGLRRDFNVALEQEKGFAAAYERAAGGVAKFGADRIEVDKIAAGRTDTAAITGRFQKLDAEIGKAASELPGKSEGKSFTSELAERASEIVRKAVDTVQATFRRIQTGASLSPGPS